MVENVGRMRNEVGLPEKPNPDARRKNRLMIGYVDDTQWGCSCKRFKDSASLQEVYLVSFSPS